MHDLIRLYLAALRSGDRPLAAALARALRGSTPLRDEADRALAAEPRGPARWSVAAERVVGRILGRLR
jgi:hypothetical protein